MKKFASLLLTVVLLATTLTVFAVPASAATEYIYLDTGGINLWNQQGASFAVWTWGGNLKGSKAVQMTHDSGDIYKVDKSQLGSGFSFIRLVAGKTAKDFDWTSATMLNQTCDLTMPTNGNNCYKITGMGNSDGMWTTYTPPEDAAPAEGSVLSGGSLTIICSVAAVVVFGLGGFLIGTKKKKKLALASGENTDEE